MRLVLHLLLGPGGKLLAPWSAVRGVYLAGQMVHHRCQGCSDRLLLVSPPRAQSSLPATLSSSHHGLPARLGHEKLSNSRAKQGSPNLSEPAGGDGGGGGSDVGCPTMQTAAPNYGAMSLSTPPPALYLCTGPLKKNTSAQELPATSFSTGELWEHNGLSPQPRSCTCVPGPKTAPGLLP